MGELVWTRSGAEQTSTGYEIALKYAAIGDVAIAADIGVLANGDVAVANNMSGEEGVIAGLRSPIWQLLQITTLLPIAASKLTDWSACGIWANNDPRFLHCAFARLDAKGQQAISYPGPQARDFFVLSNQRSGWRRPAAAFKWCGRGGAGVEQEIEPA